MEKKLCTVRVLGIMEREGETEEIETVSKGIFDFSNNHTEIRYKEISEETGEETKVCISFSESKAAGGLECRMTKTGVIQSDMLFIPGYQTMCIYQTPFGNLEFEIDTECVELDIEEERIQCHLSYTLSSDRNMISSAEVYVTATL